MGKKTKKTACPPPKKGGSSTQPRGSTSKQANRELTVMIGLSALINCCYSGEYECLKDAREKLFNALKNQPTLTNGILTTLTPHCSSDAEKNLLQQVLPQQANTPQANDNIIEDNKSLSLMRELTLMGLTKLDITEHVLISVLSTFIDYSCSTEEESSALLNALRKQPALVDITLKALTPYCSDESAYHQLQQILRQEPTAVPEVAETTLCDSTTTQDRESLTLLQTLILRKPENKTDSQGKKRKMSPFPALILLQKLILKMLTQHKITIDQQEEIVAITIAEQIDHFFKIIAETGPEASGNFENEISLFCYQIGHFSAVKTLGRYSNIHLKLLELYNQNLQQLKDQEQPKNLDLLCLVIDRPIHPLLTSKALLTCGAPFDYTVTIPDALLPSATNNSSTTSMTPLLYAIAVGNTAAVKAFLTHYTPDDSRLNVPKDNNPTPLIYACHTATAPAIITALLEKGCDPNAFVRHGKLHNLTPLAALLTTIETDYSEEWLKKVKECLAALLHTTQTTSPSKTHSQKTMSNKRLNLKQPFQTSPPLSINQNSHPYYTTPLAYLTLKQLQATGHSPYIIEMIEMLLKASEKECQDIMMTSKVVPKNGSEPTLPDALGCTLRFTERIFDSNHSHNTNDQFKPSQLLRLLQLFFQYGYSTSSTPFGSGQTAQSILKKLSELCESKQKPLPLLNMLNGVFKCVPIEKGRADLATGDAFLPIVLNRLRTDIQDRIKDYSLAWTVFFYKTNILHQEANSPVFRVVGPDQAWHSFYFYCTSENLSHRYRFCCHKDISGQADSAYAVCNTRHKDSKKNPLPSEQLIRLSNQIKLLLTQIYGHYHLEDIPTWIRQIANTVLQLRTLAELTLTIWALQHELKTHSSYSAPTNTTYHLSYAPLKTVEGEAKITINFPCRGARLDDSLCIAFTKAERWVYSGASDQLPPWERIMSFLIPAKRTTAGYIILNPVARKLPGDFLNSLKVPDGLHNACSSIPDWKHLLETAAGPFSKSQPNPAPQLAWIHLENQFELLPIAAAYMMPGAAGYIFCCRGFDSDTNQAIIVPVIYWDLKQSPSQASPPCNYPSSIGVNWHSLYGAQADLTADSSDTQPAQQAPKI